MKRTITAASLVICALGIDPAVARNEIRYYPINPVLRSAEFPTRIGTAVRFSFGDTVPGSVTGAQESVGDGAVHFHDRTELETCNDAFLYALGELKDSAVSQGGATVVNIVSFFRRKLYSSAEQYECHIGLTGAKVTLRGMVAK